MTYVLIGCDGANSGVADVLELKPKKVFSSCAFRNGNRKGVEGSRVDKRNDTGNNQGVPSSRNGNGEKL
ncbi:hypothetical protein ACOSQ4_003785 [Xanthoceras sorbifolium]